MSNGASWCSNNHSRNQLRQQDKDDIVIHAPSHPAIQALFDPDELPESYSELPDYRLEEAFSVVTAPRHQNNPAKVATWTNENVQAGLAKSPVSAQRRLEGPRGGYGSYLLWCPVHHSVFPKSLVFFLSHVWARFARVVHGSIKIS